MCPRSVLDSPSSPHRRVAVSSLRVCAALALAAALLLGGCATGSPRSDDPALATTTTVPPQSEAARGLIIIAHGSNGQVDEWPSTIEQRIRTLGDTSVWDIFLVNWPLMSDHYLTASVTGYRLGRELGTQLAGPDYQYEIIHLIGQSLGAGVINGIAEAYREHRPTDAPHTIIHMTFLDPFDLRGVFGWSYGVHHFGENADFAESYFVRDEPVVFTNTPLEHAFNFDIRAVIPEVDNPHFTYYHDWPIWFYRNSIGSLTPGFALSPLALGAFRPDGAYDPSLLREALPPGGLRVLRGKVQNR